MPTRRPVKPTAPAPMPAPPPTPPRGRPRSADARARVLHAARTLADTNGPAAVTIEAISAQAGVSKPTIYRTWPNAQAVVMAALMQTPPAAAAGAARGSAVDALRRQLRDIVTTFATRTGRSVTLMLAASSGETELSKTFRHHFILARRDEGRQMLAAAIGQGELYPDTNVEVALDALYGPIFFRILVGHAPVDAAFCDQLLDQLVAGLRGSRPGARPATRARVPRRTGRR